MKFVNYLALLLCLYSCSSGDKGGKDVSSYRVIDFENLENGLPFEDSEGNLNYELVQLETNDNSLIKSIEKVEVDDDCIFVQDMNNALFCFSKNDGKFLNRIGRVGIGPEEYLSLSDFYLDKTNNEVCVYDPHQSAMLVYTYDGKFERKEDAEYGEMGEVRGLNYLDDGTLIATMSNGPDSHYAFRVIDTDGYELMSEELPFCQIGKVHSSLVSPQVASNGKACFALAFLSDTIYRYSPQTGMVPAFLFKGSLKHRTADCWDKDKEYETGMDLVVSLKLDGYSVGLGELYLIGDYLHFRYYGNGGESKVFLNLKTGKACKYKVEYMGDCIKSISNYITTTDDALVTMISGTRFVDLVGKFPQYENLEIKGKEPLQEDNNPILVFYYIKESV